jgi:hypothetical protein
MYCREATAWSQKGCIDVMHVRQVGREQDFSSLGPDNAVSDSEESV